MEGLKLPRRIKNPKNQKDASRILLLPLIIFHMVLLFYLMAYPHITTLLKLLYLVDLSKELINKNPLLHLVFPRILPQKNFYSRDLNLSNDPEWRNRFSFGLRGLKYHFDELHHFHLNTNR